MSSVAVMLGSFVKGEARGHDGGTRRMEEKEKYAARRMARKEERARLLGRVRKDWEEVSSGGGKEGWRVLTIFCLCGQVKEEFFAFSITHLQRYACGRKEKATIAHKIMSKYLTITPRNRDECSAGIIAHWMDWSIRRYRPNIPKAYFPVEDGYTSSFYLLVYVPVVTSSVPAKFLQRKAGT